MEYGVCFDLETTRVLCNDNDWISFKTPVAVDIYYGVSSSQTVSENFIKSNFFISTGYVGSPTGRYYDFPTGYTYKYWCIPDEPNDGIRVIKEISYGGGSTTVLAYDAFYKYYQTDPTPAPSITYGKIVINGYSYRIYRTITKASTNNEQYVYCFV